MYNDEDAVYERWRHGLVGYDDGGSSGRACWRRKSCCAAAKLLCVLPFSSFLTLFLSLPIMVVVEGEVEVLSIVERPENMMILGRNGNGT